MTPAAFHDTSRHLRSRSDAPGRGVPPAFRLAGRGYFDRAALQRDGDQRFDSGRRWLPARPSGADGATALSAEDRLRLTHVEMGAYAHLFGYVEEFIAPKVLDLAQDHAIDIERPSTHSSTSPRRR